MVLEGQGPSSGGLPIQAGQSLALRCCSLLPPSGDEVHGHTGRSPGLQVSAFSAVSIEGWLGR